MMSNLVPGDSVLVYQKELDAKETPFKAEVLEIKNSRIYLRWELKGGGFTNAWVNSGCCSTNRYRPSIPKKPALQII